MTKSDALTHKLDLLTVFPVGDAAGIGSNRLQRELSSRLGAAGKVMVKLGEGW